ncbi:hypothetical protein BIU96_15455 [Curtobacterium sp. MCBA15_008]|nr:hypothetical protein BIU96_15455 [Curtobacterium sp. MCBA15_008]
MCFWILYLYRTPTGYATSCLPFGTFRLLHVTETFCVDDELMLSWPAAQPRVAPKPSPIDRVAVDPWLSEQSIAVFREPHEASF